MGTVVVTSVNRGGGTAPFGRLRKKGKREFMSHEVRHKLPCFFFLRREKPAIHNRPQWAVVYRPPVKRGLLSGALLEQLNERVDEHESHACAAARAGLVRLLRLKGGALALVEIGAGGESAAHATPAHITARPCATTTRHCPATTIRRAFEFRLRGAPGLPCPRAFRPS